MESWECNWENWMRVDAYSLFSSYGTIIFGTFFLLFIRPFRKFDNNDDSWATFGTLHHLLYFLTLSDVCLAFGYALSIFNANQKVCDLQGYWIQFSTLVTLSWLVLSFSISSSKK